MPDNSKVARIESKSPLISVIVPVYNAEKTVGKTVRAILQQNMKDFELILVDDGSTDKSLQVLRGLKKSNPNILIRSQKNTGPGSARNTGLQKAKGEFILFVDADDTVKPNTLTYLSDYIHSNTTADLLVFGWETVSDETKKVSTHSPDPKIIDQGEISGEILASLGNDNYMYNVWNKLFRASIIRDHLLTFREDLLFGEDLLFILSYIKYAKQIRVIPEVLYIHQNNSSGTYSHSSLSPAYREPIVREFHQYFAGSADVVTSQAFSWVLWRWYFSYSMLVATSDKSRKEKISLIRQTPKQGLVVAKSPQHIGVKKWLLEILLSTATKSASLSLLIGHIGGKTKRLLQ